MNKENNPICKLLGIEYPIIQGGMAWVSGGGLVGAVSAAGGLGVIGSGSMTSELLRHHIRKARSITDRPFAVNVPMMYHRTAETIDIMEEEGVKIIITSAGNPATFTPELKKRGFTVLHVVSSVRQAVKAAQSGVDAVIAEGFEAGGHNGKQETTTMVLTPAVVAAVDIPVVAAGGIASGGAMAAAMALGAVAVQIGSLFIAADESSAHPAFVEEVLKADEGDTMLTLKELSPVRLLKNPFYEQVQEAYKNNATIDELKELLGKGRAREGMLCGNLDKGELEVGQVCMMMKKRMPASEIIKELIEQYNSTLERIKGMGI